MDNKGTFIAQVYTSRARLPVENATVKVTTTEETPRILGIRTTNSSGKTEELIIDTPSLSTSQSPDNGIGFTSVDVKVNHPEFYTVIIRNVQLFPDTGTLQLVELIPVEETNSRHDSTETVNITPQNL